jgi:nucleotide-binding universal stress UspA family protein
MGRIVVGVDGSASSTAALAWALDEAARRDASLDVVTTWTWPALAALPVPSPTLHELSVQARSTMDRTLDRLGPHPNGRIERIVAQGHPAGTLIDAAEGAELLVVGSGDHPGSRLGSTSFHCAMHAPCPVVVVPTVP